MSTYIYLQCLNHTPPLRASEESGQHLYDLPRIRAEIADRVNVAAGPDYYRGDIIGGTFDFPAYFRVHSARFLAEHPQCAIGIVDEYGNEHPTEDPDA